MAARKQRTEEPEERSTLAGAAVLVVLGGAGFAVLFAWSEAAGILAVWVVSTAACWWTVRRRVSDSSATPPPPSAAPSGDEYAVESTRVREVRKGPGEGITIFPEIEHVTLPDADGEVNTR